MKKLLKNKKGFGIVGILISAAILGFAYLAVLSFQEGSQDVLLRIRGRDGAVEVAHQVLDSLKSMGMEAIPSNETRATTFYVPDVDRKCARSIGDSATVRYSSQVTVEATSNQEAQSPSPFEAIQHVYAKQVKVKVSWMFKGTTQSIEVSSVIR